MPASSALTNSVTSPREAAAARGRLDTFRKCVTLIEPRKRRQWVGLLLLAIVVSVLEAVAALLLLLLLSLITSPESSDLPLLGNVQERFPGTDPNSLILGIAIFIAFFFLIRGLANLAQNYLQNRMAHTAGAALALRLVRGYLHMPYVVYVQRNSSELIRNTHESTLIFSQQILFPAATLLSEALMAIAIFIVLVVTAPVTTAIAIGLLSPPLILLLKKTQPRLQSLGHLGMEMSGQTLKSLQQTLHGLRDIRVLGRESFFENEFLQTRSQLSRAFYLRAVLVDAPRLVLETALILFIVLFVAVQIATGASTGRTLSSLGLFGYAALRMLPSLNRVMNCVQSLRFGIPYIDVLQREALEADRVTKESIEADRTELAFEKAISLEGVSFTYGGARSPALTDIHLTIGRGEWLGIVGPTGGGKSTLVDVLLCLLAPTSGVMRIDGRDVQECVDGWQGHLGVVPQHVFLLDNSIRRNIAFGLTDAEMDDAKLTEAVRMAQLQDFVLSLPDGLDTMVGERGVQLSGGQRQRVAIARALYEGPDVLIFDEGTSALDNKTEADLIRAIEGLRGERTLITVAHRLTTVRACDRIVLVSDGRVVDVGRFDDLVNRNAEFRAMAN